MVMCHVNAEEAWKERLLRTRLHYFAGQLPGRTRATVAANGRPDPLERPPPSQRGGRGKREGPRVLQERLRPALWGGQPDRHRGEASERRRCEPGQRFGCVAIESNG